jgi:hypothetical protein
MLIIGPPGSGKCKLLESVIGSFDNVIWVTTLSSAEFVRRRVHHNNLWVIDTFTWKERESLTEKDIVVKNPLNLNEISLSITKVIEGLEGTYFLVVNSISGLLVYHNYQRLIHFLRSLLVKIEDDKASGAFTLIKDAHERNIEISISMFFPNIVMMERNNLHFVKTVINVDNYTLDFRSEKARELITEILRSE